MHEPATSEPEPIAPGYVTDPGTNHRIFGDLTLTPVQGLSFTDDGSIMLQQSFPAIQRSNRLYVDSTFVNDPASSQVEHRGGLYLRAGQSSDRHEIHERFCGGSVHANAPPI
jgi:hypothetical protein